MRMMRDHFVQLGLAVTIVGSFIAGTTYWFRQVRAPSSTSKAPTSAEALLNTHDAADAAHKAEKKVHKKLAKTPVDPNLACQNIEFAGQGPEKSQLAQVQWSEVMKVYHGAKDDLLSWLEQNKEGISLETYAWMKDQIKNLRIQRPTTPEEADLSWRGIGVWTQDPQGSLVRVGGGFYTLLKKDAVRARFELSRLVAQAWTPCEFQKRQLTHPWAKALSCLDVAVPAIGQEKCINHSSESGWAVSTTLAQIVASPGCQIPALDQEAHSCLGKLFKNEPRATESTKSASIPASRNNT